MVWFRVFSYVYLLAPEEVFLRPERINIALIVDSLFDFTGHLEGSLRNDARTGAERLVSLLTWARPPKTRCRATWLDLAIAMSFCCASSVCRCRDECLVRVERLVDRLEPAELATLRMRRCGQHETPSAKKQKARCRGSLNACHLLPPVRIVY